MILHDNINDPMRNIYMNSLMYSYNDVINGLAMIF